MGVARRSAVCAAFAACVAPLLASCGIADALGDADAGDQTATVAVVVPREGSQQADGQGVLAAAELALAETAHDIKGWTIQVVAVDEGEEPDETAAAVEKVAELADSDLVAVVGGLSTSAVRALQPVLDDASVLFVSPADVNPAHTRGADPNAPLRPYRSYFRTAVTAEPPEAELARYAVAGLDARTVAVIDGGDAAQAKRFADAARAAGAEVTGPVAGLSTTDVVNAVRAADQAEAQAVFVSGEPSVAAVVAREIGAAGLDAELLGTSAVRDGEFVQAAGRDGEGAVTALPPELEPTAGADPAELSARLAEAGGAELGQHGAAAYDAGAALGAVLSRCLPPASSAAAARKGCVGELFQVDFAGATGEVAFDDYGDRVGGRVRIEILRAGEWTAIAGS